MRLPRDYAGVDQAIENNQRAGRRRLRTSPCPPPPSTGHVARSHLDSSAMGWLFLVGQGYQVLALSIIVAVSLSKGEPFKTILRQDRAAGPGSFTFAFVMLNIYLAFSRFLIIWSGNLPEEIPWYLDRFMGGWA